MEPHYPANLSIKSPTLSLATKCLHVSTVYIVWRVSTVLSNIANFTTAVPGSDRFVQTVIVNNCLLITTMVGTILQTTISLHSK